MAAALLAGLAVLVLLARPPDRRLARVLPPGHGARSHVPRIRGASPSAGTAASAVGALALAALLPSPVGLLSALAVVVVGPRALARLEPRAVRDERDRLARDAPLLLDLLASCLAGGAALPQAAAAVSAALPGPAGRRLDAVVAALAVGCPPAEAWRALAGEQPDDPLARAARALARAADGGAPVAAAVAAAAADARAEARARGEVAARRVGVAAVAPLGLCFLPAFVLLGIVPLVAGLAGPLLASF